MTTASGNQLASRLHLLPERGRRPQAQRPARLMATRRSPLKRNVDAGEVGSTALFLCSQLARGITGEILFVDAGYHITGL